MIDVIYIYKQRVVNVLNYTLELDLAITAPFITD